MHVYINVRDNMARTTANVDRPTAVIWVRGPAPTRQHERELIARTIQQLYAVRAVIWDDFVRGNDRLWYQHIALYGGNRTAHKQIVEVVRFWHQITINADPRPETLLSTTPTVELHDPDTFPSWALGVEPTVREAA
jgi:hypothetical protein